MRKRLQWFVSTPIRFCVTFCLCAWVLLIACHYPFATDPIVVKKRGAVREPGRNFYEDVYSAKVQDAPDESDDIYVKTATRMANLFHIKDRVEAFAADYHLHDKTVLEVGAGRGYLQDVVSDYTGLDISPTARRYFHKPFVEASATEMPFADGAFDAIWTIWVLEHVPNPEQALFEMRRVVKNGGVLYLFPAWGCKPWAAQGYEVRKYTDLDLKGKMTKASLPLRTSPLFQMMYLYPIRLTRNIETAVLRSETPYKYTRLAPNYREYWVPDSDAVNSLDRFEAILWFRTRGDECLNCGTASEEFLSFDGPLIIRVKKKGPGRFSKANLPKNS